MTVDEKKTFVIKHAFTDVKNINNLKCCYGPENRRFTIPWRMYICNFTSIVGMCLECLKSKEESQDEWSIDTAILAKVFTKDGEKVIENKVVFTQKDPRKFLHELTPLEEYLIDGNLTIEYHVTINSMTGINKPIMRSFDDESAKECSDVVLKVKERKFHVCKMYLAAHSSYFKSLFLGKLDESRQPEVELKDIDPNDFQKFLEVLYASPDINDDTVEGILELSDMYDAKVAIRQCEKFLVHDSERNLKEKFLLATKYMLEDLKKKCMPEFKTFEDIASIIPEDPSQFDYAVWKELLNLSLSFHKENAQK